MRITGTFIDEISHDIAHQNWGREEWRKDFAHMQAIGIDTVILILSGYRRFLTYPSAHLMARFGCYEPPVDLVKMFLELADEFNMAFYFGLYDSGQYWDTRVDKRPGKVGATDLLMRYRDVATAMAGGGEGRRRAVNGSLFQHEVSDFIRGRFGLAIAHHYSHRLLINQRLPSRKRQRALTLIPAAL